MLVSRGAYFLLLSPKRLQTRSPSPSAGHIAACFFYFFQCHREVSYISLPLQGQNDHRWDLCLMEVLGESCYVLRMCEFREVEMQMGGRALFILSKPGVRRGPARDGGMEGPGGLSRGPLRKQPG